jgi:hypothetical protein
MFYKLSDQVSERGNVYDKDGNRKTLFSAALIHSPSGNNPEWVEFISEEECLVAWELTKIDIEAEKIEKRIREKIEKEKERLDRHRQR